MANGTGSSRSTQSASIPRDRNRKAKIVSVARQLFRERGYHAVGIDEIGEAAGITGPGVYRHFEGKQDVLVAALRGSVDEVWQGIEGHEDDPPDEVLERFLRSHVEFTVRNSELVLLWYQEWRNLPADARAEQRRLQRRFVESWVTTLRELRPELSVRECRVRVHAAIGMIHSIVTYEHGYRTQPLVDLLSRMGYAALMA